MPRESTLKVHQISSPSKHMSIFSHRAMAVLFVLFILLNAASAHAGFWRAKNPWPMSSEIPVEVLNHPTVEERMADGSLDTTSAYQFVVFGDQRALADGEWQRMIADIHDRRTAEAAFDPRFIVDTGDIVYRGSHSDQYAMLTEILSPVNDLPYLVGVGNHEVYNNQSAPARENTAIFLAYLDTQFSAERYYYEKIIGPAHFIFLDTNDLESMGEDPAIDERALAQLKWLAGVLSYQCSKTRIVVIHHPLLQSSKMHEKQAQRLWSLRHGGRRLVDMLLDAGVDILLTGHTHTYERLDIRREEDGRSMQLINISGRPRDEVFSWGSGRRRARDIRGEEMEELADRGWTDLGGYRITQIELLDNEKENQYALMTIAPDGNVKMQMYFLDKDEDEPVRIGEEIDLTAYHKID